MTFKWRNKNPLCFIFETFKTKSEDNLILSQSSELILSQYATINHCLEFRDYE